MDIDTAQSSFENSLISFSHDVYKEIQIDQSECVSPYSIISALLMLMVGTGGTSKSQLRSAVLKNNWNDEFIYQQYKALGDKVFNSTENELSIATKLFVMKGLKVKQNVRDVAKNYFNAEIGHKDFSKAVKSATEINSYIAKWTKNRITDFVSPNSLSSDIVMFLVNAVYFKGVWDRAFDPKSTRKRDFFLTETNTVQIDMMYMKHYVRYYNGKDYSAISLPYAGRKYEMVIVLPRRIDGLNALKQSFSPAMALDIETKLVNMSIVVNIPKFTFESKTDLKALLPKLGIIDIFDERSADLSNLIQGIQKRLVVSEARHKVFIEVNEKGTEAAAVTGIGISITSIPPSFTANHPFLFYIKHEPTDVILFMGHFIAS